MQSPRPKSVFTSDFPPEIARDLHAVSQIQVVPTLLDVLCEITGMRFAAVARVDEDWWIACAVQDKINFGVVPGDQLAANSPVWRRSLAPVAVDHARLDPRQTGVQKPFVDRIESYISVPIVLPDGRFFGNLCAIDPAPAQISDPKLSSIFKRFAQLIGVELQEQLGRENDQSALRDERAASELREQFIAILGHDLRNPLQAILFTSEVVARKSAEPEIARMALRIKANAKRMFALIDDVLDFARGRLGGGIGVVLEETEKLTSGLHAVVKEFQAGQPNRTIAANIEIARTVRCDLGRVQQVASNLIGNALTHGASGSPVRVTARTDDTDLILEVWNEGEPIPPENIPKVFEPFWRHEASASREGLGLGLYICSQIVRAHSGELSVISSKETGTTFTARFPLHI
jgi:signal transduction histidine kinase